MRKSRLAARGEPGYTPNEDDFCACGGWTFQPVEGTKKRKCPVCGRWEGDRRGFHQRTGAPYRTNETDPLVQRTGPPAGISLPEPT